MLKDIFPKIAQAKRLNVEKMVELERPQLTI